MITGEPPVPRDFGEIEQCRQNNLADAQPTWFASVSLENRWIVAAISMKPVLRETLATLSLLGLLAFAVRGLFAGDLPLARIPGEPAGVSPRTIAIAVVRELTPAGSPENRFSGSAGCSAVSCHGSRSLPGGEFNHWAKFDTAHRRSFEVLHSDASVAMARKLGINAAHEESRCLACHVAPDVNRTEARTERFSFEHGVGCESCHGPASEWVTAHTRPDWKSWSREQKSAVGYRDLKSLVTRAETCVACHVGSAAATVDHDLIAAGHPRLLFDMAAFHDQLPKHWAERAAVRREPDQELRLWVIGQAASTRALSEIVASRAEVAVEKRSDRVVPDLAEWDCHACHHDLADESWRGNGQGLKSLGSAAWGSWIVPSARVAARESKQLFGIDGAAAEQSLSRLTGLIQPSRFGAVSAAELLNVARQSNRDADAWLRSLESSHWDARQGTDLLNRFLAKESDTDWLPTWDGQAQRYLALLAARQSVRDLTGVEPLSRLGTEPVGRLQDRLRYPVGYATPQGFKPDDAQRLIRELRNE